MSSSTRSAPRWCAIHVNTGGPAIVSLRRGGRAISSCRTALSPPRPERAGAARGLSGIVSGRAGAGRRRGDPAGDEWRLRARLGAVCAGDRARARPAGGTRQAREAGACERAGSVVRARARTIKNVICPGLSPIPYDLLPHSAYCVPSSGPIFAMVSFWILPLCGPSRLVTLWFLWRWCALRLCARGRACYRGVDRGRGQKRAQKTGSRQKCP